MNKNKKTKNKSTKQVDNDYDLGYKTGYETGFDHAKNEFASWQERPATPIEAVLYELEQLFLKKNLEYSRGDNIFANFDESAPVQQGIMSRLTYCMTLCAKQDDAFWKAVGRSDGDKHIRERLLDGAVYRIIALTLLDRKT